MAKNKVILPSELTAENGAKHLLIGGFYETVELECHECYYDDDDDCDVCGGTGVCEQKVYIEWSTMKDIYDTIVKNMGEKT